MVGWVSGDYGTCDWKGRGAPEGSGTRAVGAGLDRRIASAWGTAAGGEWEEGRRGGDAYREDVREGHHLAWNPRQKGGAYARKVGERGDERRYDAVRCALRWANVESAYSAEHVP